MTFSSFHILVKGRKKFVICGGVYQLSYDRVVNCIVVHCAALRVSSVAVVTFARLNDYTYLELQHQRLYSDPRTHG